MNNILLKILTSSFLCFSLLTTALHARELEAGEWYVRLTAISGDLKDTGNVLGQLKDSKRSYDLHDLKELSPFATPYLTIVFPHPDWGDHAGDYASDFLGIRGRSHSWTFEVRSDDPNREITLNWSSEADMTGMLLVDRVTGTKLEAQDAGQQYTFNMGGETVRGFEWVVRDTKRDKKNSNKIN